MDHTLYYFKKKYFVFFVIFFKNVFLRGKRVRKILILNLTLTKLILSVHKVNYLLS